MIYLKNAQELEKMRKAGIIVRDCLNLLEEKIKEGITTASLDKIAYDYIKGCGANPSCLGYGGFPGTLCISIDEQVVHGFPSNRVLKEGEIVSVDLVADINGFHGDAARTFAVGKVSPEKQRLINVTKECFFKAIDGLMVGSSIGDIGYAVQKHAESNGYSVVREMVGHGIGRKMHEDPSVPNYGRPGTGIRIRNGMTIAIEPMVCMGDYKVCIDGWSCVTADGLPAAHYENTVAITDEGVKILTL